MLNEMIELQKQYDLIVFEKFKSLMRILILKPRFLTKLVSSTMSSRLSGAGGRNIQVKSVGRRFGKSW